MFAFSLANLMGVMVSTFKQIEYGFIQCNGQTELLRYVAVTDIIMQMFPGFVFMLIATISSGIVYFGSGDDHVGDDHSHRMLADTGMNSESYNSDSLSVNHLPIILCFLMAFVRGPFQYLILSLRGKDDFKKVSIPLNIDFVIHRFGEWIMLMMGESVLSLLIVDITEDRNFHITFFTGVVSVVLTHNTWTEIWARFNEEQGGTRKIIGFLLLMLRVGIIAFVAFTYRIATTPEYVALLGLGCIIAQVGIRFIGDIYFPSASGHADVAHSESDKSDSFHDEENQVVPE